MSTCYQNHSERRCTQRGQADPGILASYPRTSMHQLGLVFGPGASSTSTIPFYYFFQFVTDFVFIGSDESGTEWRGIIVNQASLEIKGDVGAASDFRGSGGKVAEGSSRNRFCPLFGLFRWRSARFLVMTRRFQRSFIRSQLRVTIRLIFHSFLVQLHPHVHLQICTSPTHRKHPAQTHHLVGLARSPRVLHSCPILSLPFLRISLINLLRKCKKV